VAKIGDGDTCLCSHADVDLNSSWHVEEFPCLPPPIPDETTYDELLKGIYYSIGLERR
jgi:hypothetical protein